MNDQKSCRKPLCVGLAIRDGLCAPHAAGYDRHNGAGELRCANCRRLFGKDEWFQNRDNGVYHAKKCATHKEVLAERERAAPQATT